VEGDCLLWRMSFSVAEKEIILHADLSRHDGVEICRKDLLRLLKNDLETYNKRKDRGSYHMKTLFFYTMASKPDDEWWIKNGPCLGKRYIEALRALIYRLECRSMPHYFTRTVNLLQDTLADGSVWNQIIAYIKSILAMYQTFEPRTASMVPQLGALNYSSPITISNITPLPGWNDRRSRHNAGSMFSGGRNSTMNDRLHHPYRRL